MLPSSIILCSAHSLCMTVPGTPMLHTLAYDLERCISAPAVASVVPEGTRKPIRARWLQRHSLHPEEPNMSWSHFHSCRQVLEGRICFGQLESSGAVRGAILNLYKDPRRKVGSVGVHLDACQAFGWSVALAGCGVLIQCLKPYCRIFWAQNFRH